MPKRFRLVARPGQPVVPTLGFELSTQGWLFPPSLRAQLEVVPRSLATGFTMQRLIAFGLATRSPIALEALALRATSGQFSFDGLVAVAAAAESSAVPAERIIVAAQVDALVGLVQVAAATECDDDVVRGLLTLAIAHAHDQPHARVLTLVFLLIALGRRRDAIALLPRMHGNDRVSDFAIADLLNPFLDDGIASDTVAWLAAVNAVFHRSGLELVALDESAHGTPLDRLRCAEQIQPVVRGPLVTIIMSSFEPGDDLVSAVRSIVAQTWQNWELLVVDDASGEDFDEVLATVADLDPRVTILRAAHNAGTYVRRNEALQRARGEFVTMHDSDDWAHPRRIELQARHLQASPAVVANTVHALRVTDQLLFTQPRGVRMHLAEPGLMFRREPVLARIGYFDSVRRAADTEFRLRLQKAFDVTVPVIAQGAPLLLMRYGRGSLSGHDLADGWTHPSRFAYRSAHLLWREAMGRRGAAFMPFPLEQRPFPAPDHMTGVQNKPSQLDILVMLDGRRTTVPGRDARRIARELRDAAAAGLSVGVMHVQTPYQQWIAPELHAALQACISQGVARQVLVGDAVTARVLVARHASSLGGLPLAAEPVVGAQRVVVVRDSTARLDVDGHTYSRAWCDRIVLAYTGRAAEWRDVDHHGIALAALVDGQVTDR